MAKKRTGPTPAADDRHKPGSRMLRLPPDHAAMLDRLAETEERTRTMIVVRALKAYYAANGYEFPPKD